MGESFAFFLLALAIVMNTYRIYHLTERVQNLERKGLPDYEKLTNDLIERQ